MKKLLAKLITGCITLATFSLAISAITLGWFSGPSKQADKEVVDGQIGLRGYFYAGNGTSLNPYEIVDSTHFYNLARLQNLGIFTDPATSHFQIGHVFDLEKGPQCYNGRLENGEPAYDDFLNMGPLCATEGIVILPVGSEGTPFVGTFNGNGIPIQNLTVQGHPEDIGVFGYVAYEGVVEGLVCQDLTIVSLGYSQEDSDVESLFGQEVDELFDSADYLATDTSLSFYDWNGSTYVEKPLKRHNTLPITTLTNMDNKVISGTAVYNGYFKPTYPNVPNDPFTYSWKASASLIQDEILLDTSSPADGTPDNAIVFDMAALRDSADFQQSEIEVISDVRISLVASIEVGGFRYSRVIQSYNCEFSSNGYAYGSGQVSCTIMCDYQADDTPGDHPTGYHHGNNIGFLCGHLNGLMRNCYVYNASFRFNETGYHPIEAESDIGLVGEVGKNVINTLDPELSLVTNGDIGIMNFSKIYDSIRENFATSDVTYAGNIGGQSYISYTDKLVSGAKAKYGDYLRYYSYGGEKYYITTTNTDMVGTPPNWYSTTLGSVAADSDFNSIDFIEDQLIQDEDAEENIFGVFKITTSHSTNEDKPYINNFLNHAKESRIMHTTPKTKVYFSTAEYQPSLGGSFNAFKPTTIPTVHDLESFNYPFSRDYNYCFELDLGQMNSLPAGKNYMYNTDSIFLQNYLHGILRDKIGNYVTPGSSKFGFMFLSSDNERYTEFTSYMPVGRPGAKYHYEDDEGGTPLYYPANSIVFSIKNSYGANVSVVGNGEDISIYGFNAKTSSGSATELYRMKNKPTGGTDSLRYFSYNVATGETGTTITDSGEGVSSSLNDSGQLYGHIFFLPPGDYCIGSNNSNDANIYFLAVQGQDNASIGSKDIAYVGTKLENTDFLTKAPTVADFRGNTLEYSLFTFISNYNTVAGEFTVGVTSVDDKRYISITFSDTPNVFTTRLFVYSQHTEHTYYINGVRYTLTPMEYPR